VLCLLFLLHIGRRTAAPVPVVDLDDFLSWRLVAGLGLRCRWRAEFLALGCSHAVLSARGAASDQTKQPDCDQDDDRQPDQVDQTTGRVEKQPENEKNGRYDKQCMDHSGHLLADVDLINQDRKNPKREPYANASAGGSGAIVFAVATTATEAGNAPLPAYDRG
jgi:hypothetical protein